MSVKFENTSFGMAQRKEFIGSMIDAQKKMAKRYEVIEDGPEKERLFVAMMAMIGLLDELDHFWGNK